MTLLLATLQMSVPLSVRQLCELREDAREALIEAWRTEALDVVPSKADVMLFGGSPRGLTAKDVFAAFSRGLAALAFQPGGVTFGDLHWCVGSGHNGTVATGPGPCLEEVAREQGAASAAVAPPRRRPLVDVYLPPLADETTQDGDAR